MTHIFFFVGAGEGRERNENWEGCVRDSLFVNSSPHLGIGSVRLIACVNFETFRKIILSKSWKNFELSLLEFGSLPREIQNTKKENKTILVKENPRFSFFFWWGAGGRRWSSSFGSSDKKSNSHYFIREMNRRIRNRLLEASLIFWQDEQNSGYPTFYRRGEGEEISLRRIHETFENISNTSYSLTHF